MRPSAAIVRPRYTRSRRAWITALDYAGMVLALGGLILLFSSLSDNFLTASALRTLANQIPSLIVMSVGMTLVLIIGGIDLSVGSVMALSSAVLGVALVNWELPLIAAVPLALLVGAGCGFLSGVVSVGFRIPSFIVTLGMLEAARGGAYMVTQSQTKYIGETIERLSNPIGSSGLSAAFFVAVVIAIIGQVVLIRTVAGRYMIAIGTNEEAVRLSGINPRPTKVAVFMISGTLAALSGVFNCSRLSTADPNAGIGWELSAIAAVVIGGTSLMGGRGSVVKTIFGVLIIAVLESGLSLVGVSEPLKRVVTGSVIVMAVILDAFRTRKMT